VQVKEGYTRVAARCLHPQVAQERIREGARRALESSVAPFVLPTPITVRIEFHRALHADMAALTPGSRRLDGRTVAWTGENMQAVYGAFQAMMSLAARAG
jgi:D-amino peptidase